MAINDAQVRIRIENQIAYDVTQLLLRDPRDTKAFTLGLVDKDGTILREAETPEEEVELTLLDKTAFYLRRLLGGKVNRLRNFAQIHLDGDVEVSDSLMLRGTRKDGSRINRMNQAYDRKTLN